MFTDDDALRLASRAFTGVWSGVCKALRGSADRQRLIEIGRRSISRWDCLKEELIKRNKTDMFRAVGDLCVYTVGRSVQCVCFVLGSSS